MPEPLMRQAGMSTSRAPGPSTGPHPAGRRGSSSRMTAGLPSRSTRDWALVPGGSAYLPRGPVAMGADPAALAARLIGIADALAGEGIDVVAADPEVPASETAFRAAIEAAGFTAIEEIQPSRHRISLPLAGRTEEEVFAGISKSTRQRIRKAEDEVDPVVRHDARVGPGGVGDGFAAPSEPPEVALDRFYDLLLQTGSGCTSRSAHANRSSPGGARRSRPVTSSTSRRGASAGRRSRA